jgi:hypothetical protein
MQTGTGSQVLRCHTLSRVQNRAPHTFALITTDVFLCGHACPTYIQEVLRDPGGLLDTFDNEVLAPLLQYWQAQSYTLHQ